MDYPKVSVWITSTGRFEFLKTTIDSFMEHNTYPNIEWLIFESIPTEESLKYFNTPLMDTDKCLEYLKEVRASVPEDTDMRIWAEPWPPFGNVLSKFLTLTTAEYAICLEDDCLCMCDPKEQWLDGIELLKNDPNLLGFRNDLSNPTVDETDERFVGVKRHPISDYLYWPTAGGATFIDVDKMQRIGGYPIDHPLKDFWRIECHQNEAMANHDMYMGVMLKYFGSFAHIGHTEVTGRDRAWSKKIYMDMVNEGYFGRRDKRTHPHVIANQHVLLQEYWRKHHVIGNPHALSGNMGKTTWANLNVTDKIVSGSHVLEIGPGLGYSVIGMVHKSVHVSIMDVVPEAFECVKASVEHTYLDGVDKLPEQYFDLVISYNVSCHQSDDTLRNQIKAVVRSLKPDGIFALGVAANGLAPWPKDFQPKCEIDVLEAGAMMRSEDKIKQIVNDAGGQIISIHKGIDTIDDYIYSYAVHIKRMT